jgi:hypothetical protein
MNKGRLKEAVTNTVLDMTITLGHVGETVYIHEDHGSSYEVSAESNPSLTFYARKDQVELLQ